MACPPRAGVLEIGPGTGPVTNAILQVLDERDRFDLVEINEMFAEHLRKRFLEDPAWTKATVPWNLHVGDLLELDLEPGYDAIISGVPVNNFSPDVVRQNCRKVDRVGGGREATTDSSSTPRSGRSGNTWSVPPSGTGFVGVEMVLDEYLDKHETKRQVIFSNVPPAVVHHLTL